MQLIKSYLMANQCVKDEFDRVPLKLNGTIPAALNGVLFRNGNGRFVHQHMKYKHLFDGDGMISRFEIKGQSIHYSNRYVRTEEFVAEEAAGKILHRSFGTNIPGGFWKNFLKMKFKNAANTSLVWHNNKLLALWEGGWPHEVDPESLETISRYHYEGLLQNQFSWLDRKIAPEMAFSAHPKRHEASGTLYNFGIVAGTKQRLLVYAIPKEGKPRIEHEIVLKETTFIHDFIVTASGHIIFYITPFSFDIFRTFMGFIPPVESLKAKESSGHFLVIQPNGKQHWIKADRGFIFHYFNGFDLEDDKIVLDAITMNEFPVAASVEDFLSGVGKTEPGLFVKRIQIDLKKRRLDASLVHEYEAELPEINPNKTGKPYRYGWSVGRAWDQPSQLLNQIVKHDFDNRMGITTKFEHALPSEPVVVPKPNATKEDEAWLLYLLYEEYRDTTSLVIAEASDLSTIATALLPHHIPLGFHGLWLA